VTFALGTFSRGNEGRFAALCLGEQAVPLAAVHGQAVQAGAGWREGATVLELLQQWDAHLPALRRLAEALAPAVPAAALPIASLTPHPPVDLPRQVFCTGANYRKHVVDLTVDSGVGPEGLTGDALRRWAEDMMDERARVGEPYAFMKAVSAITGAQGDILLPQGSVSPDWEAELVVVIGRGGRRIKRENAMQHIAGFAIANDVTCRDRIARTDYKMLGTDWLQAKSPPTFLPFGPVLVPACFVRDPHDLKIVLKLNGEVMQNETTADMIFDIPRQIEYISQHAELLPGDLICTGSPAGNGTHYNRFLRPGDVLDVTIEGLGAQRNVCVADTAE
jgi:2-keto-4-pentenoate hydratase/2-oxohepta-3-ene-1,7-dioic acid hydratase in catechol pathway